MDYSEDYRSQPGHGPLFRTFPAASNNPHQVQYLVPASREREPQGAIFNFSGEAATVDADRAELSLADKLSILSGQAGYAYPDGDWQQLSDTDLGDDFEIDSPIRQLGRQVMWHCECLYYQVIGHRIGEPIESLKQRWSDLADRRCAAAR